MSSQGSYLSVCLYFGVNEVMTKCAELEEEIQCMTVHTGLDGVCLHPWVLQAASNSYRQDYGELEAQQHV